MLKLNNYNINQLHRAYKNINKKYLIFNSDSIKASNTKSDDAVLNDIELKKLLRKELMDRLRKIVSSWVIFCYYQPFDSFLEAYYGITENMYQSLLKIERVK